jgi:hypothetical protein
VVGDLVLVPQSGVLRSGEFQPAKMFRDVGFVSESQEISTTLSVVIAGRGVSRIRISSATTDSVFNGRCRRLAQTSDHCLLKARFSLNPNPS